MQIVKSRNNTKMNLQLKKEGKFYRHNPSTVMRQVLGIKNKNFKTLEQVTIYAEKIDKEFADAQRRLNNIAGISPYSGRGLVSHFYETSYWYKLKPNSQHSYRQLLTFGCDFIPRGSNKPFGDHPYKNIDREFEKHRDNQHLFLPTIME